MVLESIHKYTLVAAWDTEYEWGNDQLQVIGIHSSSSSGELKPEGTGLEFFIYICISMYYIYRSKCVLVDYNIMWLWRYMMCLINTPTRRSLAS